MNEIPSVPVYRCFHCKQEFSDDGMAEAHFGQSPVGFPKCVNDYLAKAGGGPHDPATRIIQELHIQAEAAKGAVVQFIVQERKANQIRADVLRLMHVLVELLAATSDQAADGYADALNNAIAVTEDLQQRAENAAREEAGKGRK